MPIQFRCPHCRVKLSIARRKAGTCVNCPSCQQRVLVPIPQELAEAAEPALTHDPPDDEVGLPVPPPLALTDRSGVAEGKSAPSNPPEFVSASRAAPAATPAAERRTPGSPIPLAAPPPIRPNVPPPVPAAAGQRQNLNKSRKHAAEADPLFERDLDSLLNELNPEPVSVATPARPPTAGMDASLLMNSPAPDPEHARRMTAMIAIVFTLIVLAFLAGLFIALY